MPMLKAIWCEALSWIADCQKCPSKSEHTSLLDRQGDQSNSGASLRESTRRNNQPDSFPSKVGYSTGILESEDLEVDKPKVWGSQRQSSNGFKVLTPASYSHLEIRDPRFDTHPGRKEFCEAITAFDSRNYELARHYYLKSSACGELAALHNLGVMYLHGQGIPKDQTKAIECFKLCASYNMADSMAQLGYIYLHGRGVDINRKTAIYWFQRSIECGQENNYFSKFHLAAILTESSQHYDKTRAISLLEECALNGYAPAVFNLALRAQLNGAREQAIHLFKQSAYRLGDAASQNNLGVIHANDINSGSKDYPAALQLFRMAAKQDLSEAWFNLGELYSRGYRNKGKDNTLKSARCFYKAAKFGNNSEAEFRLGILFWKGGGRQMGPNLPLALYWFQQASAKGHNAATHNAKELIKLMKRDEVKMVKRPKPSGTQPLEDH